MTWQDLMTPQFSVRLCFTLLHSLWQMAILAAVARCIQWRWARRSLQASYAAYVAALVIGIVAVPLTFLLVEGAPQARGGGPRFGDPGVSAPAARWHEPEARRPVETSNRHSPLGNAAATSSATEASMPVQMPGNPADELWSRLASWLAAVYALGVLLMLARLAIGIWSANRLASRAEPLDNGPLVAALTALARAWSLRVVPTLARAEAIVVPKVVGLIRPTILVPASAITGLSADELQMILAHELAHVRRCDLWVNLLQRLAEAVLFFNPAVWYLNRRISELRELCCDELACGSLPGPSSEARLRYASALVSVAQLSQQRLTGRGSFPAQELTAMAANGRSPSEIRRRVAHLFGEPIREPMRVTRGGLLVVLALVTLLLTGLLGWQPGANNPVSLAAAESQEPADVWPEAGEMPKVQLAAKEVERQPDTGSDLLRNLRKASAPLLAELAEKHGYALAAGQSLRRIAPPFPELRMKYYQVGHPSQSEAIPAGPSSMVFHWTDKQLHNWGMTFGQSDDPGYSVAGVLDALQGIKGQEIEGPEDLLATRLPGDWVVRPGQPSALIVRQLETILREELKLPIRLEFREVKRDVYIARGRYRLTPLPGQPTEEKLHLTDETITTDPVHIFARELVPDSGSGGGTGEFAEFLQWLGNWIESPIVDEAKERPKRQISWHLHGRSPSTEAMRREDHDAESVLKNITAQTSLTFTKEQRPIKLLFIERRD